MLKIENLTKSYGVKKLFNNFSIQGFDKADKIGIIGENGRGKSTLLKMIYGIVEPDSGTIKFDIREPQIGYMEQSVVLLEEDIMQKNESVIEYFKRNSGYQELEEKIEMLYQNYDEKFALELEFLQVQFEKLGGYDFEYKAEIILASLTNGQVSLNDKVSHLSGGQKSKVLLSLVLLKGGDILLLDEPTNNLDSKSIEWLIDYIDNSLSLVFIVSHDKYFLNQVTNKTLELGKNEIKLYSGNYDFYELEKSLEENKNDNEYLEYVEKYKKLKEDLNKEYSKVSGTNKIDRSLSLPRILMGKYKDTAQKTNGGNIRKLKKELELLSKNKPEKNKNRPLNFDLKLEEKVYGGIYIKDLKFEYPNQVEGGLKHLRVDNFKVENSEKILVTGNNGSGKTTFLKIIIGELKNFKGEVKISPSITIGNYSQEKNKLDKCEDTLLDFLIKNLPKKDLSFINNILVKFNFTLEEKNSPVSFLSPGQKNRLLLALFSLAKYNTLVLDEPTNHLDLEAVNELERALQEFNGNLIVVSHDKGFIENIKFDREYRMDEGILR